MGSIEFVATSPDFRRQGAGFALLSYIMEETPYETYVLEVADTNTNAIGLYEKLGFREMKRIKAPRGSGVNFFIYMRAASPLFNGGDNAL
jgi:ribosomal protein S18 acetylase RimI-like enzyme